MTSWVLIPNPGYEGEPRPMTSACHDGTPFLTLQCSSCERPMHMHESQIEGMRDGVEIEARCPSCRETSVITAMFVRHAFARMREDGWIA
jgi:hypothetical protein